MRLSRFGLLGVSLLPSLLVACDETGSLTPSDVSRAADASFDARDGFAITVSSDGEAKLLQDGVAPSNLRSAAAGLCGLDVAVVGGAAGSIGLSIVGTAFDGDCDPAAPGPLFCVDVRLRVTDAIVSESTAIQLTSLVPALGYSPVNADLAVGASGLGGWLYGRLDATQPEVTRRWIFERSGGEFVVRGRIVGMQEERCDGRDNDCDGRTDDGAGCFAAGAACVDGPDCSTELDCIDGACRIPPLPLGARCAVDADCASNHCATGPDGTANDRCAPSGMIWIPESVFTMGSPVGELGRQDLGENLRKVAISRNFFIGRTEVTQREWKALTGGVNPSYFQSPTGTSSSTANANDDGPLENLEFFAMLAFANAKSRAEGLQECYTLSGCSTGATDWYDGTYACGSATFAGLDCDGYRLPTDAEWEYAARAGTATATYVGNLTATLTGDTTTPTIAWTYNTSGYRTQRVAQLLPNAFGLFDMLGNVDEPVWDVFLVNDTVPTYDRILTDPIFSAGTDTRRARGGGALNWPQSSRASSSNSFAPNFARSLTRGLRIVRTQRFAAGDGGCVAGEHFDGAGCVADVRACTLENGTGQQQWSNGAWSKCLRAACDAGYVGYKNVCFLPARVPREDCTSCSGSTGEAGIRNCGPSGDEICGLSLTVDGGPRGGLQTSTYRLDKFEVSVARFRRFAQAWQDGWRPTAGSGVHRHLRSGAGLSVGTGSEVGWQDAWTGNIGRDYVWDGTLGSSGNFVATGAEPADLTDWAARLCGGARGNGTFTAGPSVRENLPMDCVNWFEAQAFCIWDGGFLPSNNEWSHAAGGGSLFRTYPWGSTTPNATLAACFDCGNALIPVGSRPLGDGYYGQSDLAGNLYEWAYDAYRSTPPTTCTDCASDQIALSDTGRYLRGGSWNDSRAGVAVMASAAINYYPVFRDTLKGVRCARTPALTGE